MDHGARRVVFRFWNAVLRRSTCECIGPTNTGSRQHFSSRNRESYKSSPLPHAITIERESCYLTEPMDIELHPLERLDRFDVARIEEDRAHLGARQLLSYLIILRARRNQ